MTKPLSAEDRQWLRELNSRIIKTSGPDESGSIHFFGKEQMSLRDWRRLMVLIVRHELPCRMTSAAYGFFILIHDQGIAPDITPDVLFRFEYWQMPGVDRGFDAQPAAARQLAHLTHTLRNQELLQWCGFEQQREPVHYCY